MQHSILLQTTELFAIFCASSFLALTFQGKAYRNYTQTAKASVAMGCTPAHQPKDWQCDKSKLRDRHTIIYQNLSQRCTAISRFSMQRSSQVRRQQRPFDEWSPAMFVGQSTLFVHVLECHPRGEADIDKPKKNTKYGRCPFRAFQAPEFTTTELSANLEEPNA